MPNESNLVTTAPADEGKPPKRNAARPGPPSTVFDYAEVRRLAGLMYSQAEITKILRVGLSTCEHNEKFREEYWAGRNGTVGALKKKQIDLALSGNVPLLIHTGKHYLGQKDAVEKTGDVKIEVVVSNDVKHAC